MKVIINLLPPERKEDQEGKKRIGLILKVGFMATLSVVVFSVFIYFSLLVVRIQKDATELSVVKLGQSRIYKDVYDVQNLIEKNYEQANQLSQRLSQQKYYWDFFDQLNQTLPQNIFLSELTVKEEKITIKGFAQTREDLINFKELLEQNEIFGEIDAPISNFTLNENINFEFDLGVN